MLAIRSFALLLLIVCSTAATATTIYKWVDKNGVTHFSQEPPQEEQVEKLHSEDIERAKTGYVAPTVRQDPKPAATEMEKSAQLIKEKDAEQAQRICDNAKQGLNVLTTHTRLNRKDSESGEPVAMTEEERQAAIKENEQRISLFCK